MVLVLPLAAGLLLAPLLGGRFSALEDLRLRALPLFYIGLTLQLSAFPLHAFPWRTPDRVAVVLWLVSYGVFVLACSFNARVPGVPFVAAGMLCNLLAIVPNGGHMPALPSALRAAGLHFSVNRNSIAAPTPHLAWLVDRWAAPSWVPWANVYSVGDVLIAVGGLVFALGAMKALPWLRLRREPEAVPTVVPDTAVAVIAPEETPAIAATPKKTSTAGDVVIALGVVVLAFGAVKALRRAAAVPS